MRHRFEVPWLLVVDLVVGLSYGLVDLVVFAWFGVGWVYSALVGSCVLCGFRLVRLVWVAVI